MRSTTSATPVNAGVVIRKNVARDLHGGGGSRLRPYALRTQAQSARPARLAPLDHIWRRLDARRHDLRFPCSGAAPTSPLQSDAHRLGEKAHDS